MTINGKQIDQSFPYQRFAQTIINSVLQSRSRLAGYLGRQFGGNRDIYQAAGYERELTFERYAAKYERQDIAGRVVRLPAEWTWREPPTLKDGDKGETEFTKAWAQLTTIDVEDIADQKTIWHYLARADKIAGVGRYGLLLVGIGDGDDLSQPIPRGNLGLDKFLYLSVFDEGSVEIDKLDTDRTSRRFNLPELYQVYVDSAIQNDSAVLVGGCRQGKKTPVHWSRVVHIAEGLNVSDIYGTPRLQNIYNRLNDLEKIAAGSGESAWLLMNKGIIISTKDGYTTESGEVATSEIEDYIHNFSRVLELEGMEAKIEGGEIVDPTGVIKTILSLISGETGIPLRLLLGNEQGQLASSQDERNYGAMIAARQVNFAEPIILRPLISRLIYTGILPKPASGNYQVEWANTFKLNEIEESEVAERNAKAAAAWVGSGMPMETYLREKAGWDDDQIEAMYAAKEKEENFMFRDQVTGIEQ